MEKTMIPALIRKGMESLGYTSLLPVQEEVLLYMDETKDLFIQAETGSGKTAAYLIPVLSMTDSLCNDTQILIIAPTRELAVQIHKETGALSVYAGIHCVCAIGGLDTEKQINALKHRPHVIIGTPGRLCDLLRQDVIDLSLLKYLIMDEADQIRSTGQAEEMNFILSKINDPRRICVSATMDDETASYLHDDYRKIIMNVSTEVNERIDEYCLLCTDKEESLFAILRHEEIESAVIFVNYKSTVKQLNQKLKQKKILSAPISSDYDEKTRLKTIEAFKAGNIRIIVATDAMARGLDLPGISHVIHYDLPLDTNTYIHRSGRSAHQQNEGITISLIAANEMHSETARMIMNESSELVIDHSKTNDLSIPLVKEKKGNDDTVMILIRGGRNEKLRPKDIVGALTSRIAFEEIGTIEIQDQYSLVRIINHDASVIDELNGLKKKKKKRRIEISRNQD